MTLGALGQTRAALTCEALKSRVALQLVATLVAEIILCCKEVNTKTRAAAYELLIDIAHAMHAARPPPDTLPDEETMGAP